MHFPHPDITADPHAQLHRELGKARRTIKYIRNCIPAETFHPENRQLRDLYLIEEYKTLYTHIKSTIPEP